MAGSILYLNDKEVERRLTWNDLFPVIEKNFADVSAVAKVTDSITIQPARAVMRIPHRNGFLVTMPGLSERSKVLGCKLVTSFLDNPTKFNMPNIMASVALFDPDTGKLKAVLEGTSITEYRTAAASVVAAKYLWKNSGADATLAVCGSGRQGRIHIIAMQHYFKFKKINLWSRTYENAQKLAAELKKEHNINVEVFQDVGKCTKPADVIVTVTTATEPFVKYENVKPDVFIIAVGVSRTAKHYCELERRIYERSQIFTDSNDNASVELKGLVDEYHVSIAGEIGEVINGKKAPNKTGIIIFHPLGMATEDAVTAQLVLDKYLGEASSS